MENQKVLIIGAGAAGLYAAYNLKHRQIDFEILEASSRIGGRVKETRDLADFPIDVGAEWLHTNPKILKDLLLFGESFDDRRFETMSYAPKAYCTYANGKIHQRNFLGLGYSEWKWKRDTWYGYLSTYILPQVQDKVHLETIVSEVRYDDDKDDSGVTVKTQDGRTFCGDKLILAVPLTVLQGDDIRFVPPLPSKKKAGLASGNMVPGMKCFIEFSEKFYPDMQMPYGMAKAITMEGMEMFYDAAFQKDTTKNVLGYFAVQKPAEKYTAMGSDEDIFQNILSLLDQMYDGKASKHYVKHHMQTWFRVPHIRGAYSYYGVKSPGPAREPLANKVYFAGEFIPPNSSVMSSTVHGAMLSGGHAVTTMCGSK